VHNRLARIFSAIIRPGQLPFARARTAVCSQFLRRRGCYGGVFAAELLLRSFLHSLLPLAFLCPQ
jgi:hypothetical protein